MRRFRFILILAIIFNVAGCGREPELGKRELTPVIMAYPYEMTSDRKKAFVEGIKSLHAGQSSNEVVKLLGHPDSQYTISAKEHDRPLGRRFVYYLKKKGDGVNEEYDQSVSLDFDNQDVMSGALVQNVPDLAAISSRLNR